MFGEQMASVVFIVFAKFKVSWCPVGLFMMETVMTEASIGFADPG